MHLSFDILVFALNFLFVWQYNYGGIQAKIIVGSAAGIIEDESQVEIISSWNIAENLPKETQVIFFILWNIFYIFIYFEVSWWEAIAFLYNKKKSENLWDWIPPCSIKLVVNKTKCNMYHFSLLLQFKMYNWLITDTCN